MALESISQATLPQEELTAILSQIESELYSTKVYRTALGILKQKLGESADGSSMLLQAVAKKAIWLTIKQWISPGQEPLEPLNEGGLVPESLELFPQSADRHESHALEDIRTPESHSQSLTTADRGAIAGKSATLRQQKPVINPFQRANKPLQAEREAQIIAQQQQQWTDRLTQIGQQLQAARCDRGLSILELYQQTLVPCRHIEAIENGILEQLPEDVYVRSFIYKIGNFLGLEGRRIADSLPIPQKKNISPASGHFQPFNLDFSVSPVHLYLGYTALMAGAIGGLGWMTDQSSPRTLPEPDSALTSPALNSTQSALPIQTPGVISSGAITCALSEIAPPEALEW